MVAQALAHGVCLLAVEQLVKRIVLSIGFPVLA
jgi:hypothetical protein